MEKVLVSGGLGFVGSHTVDAFGRGYNNFLDAIANLAVVLKYFIKNGCSYCVDREIFAG